MTESVVVANHLVKQYGSKKALDQIRCRHSGGTHCRGAWAQWLWEVQLVSGDHRIDSAGRRRALCVGAKARLGNQSWHILSS